MSSSGRKLRYDVLAFLLLAFPSSFCASFAAEPFEKETNKSNRSAIEMASRVDELLQKRLMDLGWQPAGRCDDASFLRRASLDLTGTAPTGREVLDFIENPSNTKRSDLIARLLATSNSAAHLANTWSGWLLPEADTPDVQFGRGGLQTWLRNRFAENLRYDRLAADLLVSNRDHRQ